MILKCVYETALYYGFDYRLENEKYFVLLIIEGGVSFGEELVEAERKTEAYIQDPRIPDGYVPERQIARTSAGLSRKLLYMKFLQGIPIAGAVGGAYDMICMKQISEYAGLKYKKRFLLKHKGAQLKKDKTQ